MTVAIGAKAVDSSVKEDVAQTQARTKPHEGFSPDTLRALETRGPALAPRAALTLQRTVGNRATGAMIRSRRPQRPGHALLQLKWIAGARPDLLMWDKLVEGAQWYYIVSSKHGKVGGMFYTLDGEVSEVLTHEQWVKERGAEELEDSDARVVNVHEAASEDKERRPWKVVIAEETGTVLTEAAKGFKKEWDPHITKGRKKPGKNECSGPDWKLEDEGADVAKELAENPSLMDSAAVPDGISIPYIAFYAGDLKKKPIALMMLETRRELPKEKKPKKPHMYVRWLLGSPTRRGGGGYLVEYARIVAHLRKDVEAVSVESAAAAVSWYEKQGYTQVAAATHWHVDTPCRCVYMAWPPTKAESMKAEYEKLISESTESATF